MSDALCRQDDTSKPTVMEPHTLDALDRIMRKVAKNIENIPYEKFLNCVMFDFGKPATLVYVDVRFREDDALKVVQKLNSRRVVRIYVFIPGIDPAGK